MVDWSFVERKGDLSKKSILEGDIFCGYVFGKQHPTLHVVAFE